MQEYWWSFEEVQHSQGRKGAEEKSEDLRRSTLGNCRSRRALPDLDRQLPALEPDVDHRAFGDVAGNQGAAILVSSWCWR